MGDLEGPLEGEEVRLRAGLGVATLRTRGGTMDGRVSLETGVGAASIDFGCAVVGVRGEAGASSILSVLVRRSTSPSGMTAVPLAGSLDGGFSIEVRGF